MEYFIDIYTLINHFFFPFRKILKTGICRDDCPQRAKKKEQMNALTDWLCQKYKLVIFSSLSDEREMLIFVPPTPVPHFLIQIRFHNDVLIRHNFINFSCLAKNENIFKFFIMTPSSLDTRYILQIDEYCISSTVNVLSIKFLNNCRNYIMLE